MSAITRMFLFYYTALCKLTLPIFKYNDNIHHLSIIHSFLTCGMFIMFKTSFASSQDSILGENEGLPYN